jgi:TRAP-type C4-dicarboxylate transport system substrate-binding protein
MMSFRLNEVATFHLEVPGGMYTSSFMININPKSFDGLNAGNREALMKAGGLEGSKFFGRAWDAADKASRDDGVAKKNMIETLAPDQLVKWKQLLQPVRDNWIKMAKEKGLDGDKLIADLEARVKAQSM